MGGAAAAQEFFGGIAKRGRPAFVIAHVCVWAGQISAETLRIRVRPQRSVLGHVFVLPIQQTPAQLNQEFEQILRIVIEGLMNGSMWFTPDST
jgi:hypothetical protein